MKLRSKRSALHARAELAIPWLVNGSAPPDTELALREHVSSCPECREDYEQQTRLREAMRAEGPLVFAAESSYQKLLTRIRTAGASDVEEGPEPGTPARPPLERPRAAPALRQAPPVVRWLAAAVILQAFAIGAGLWLWRSHDRVADAPYRTLTSPSASYRAGARARVVFRTDMSISALQTLLQGVGAHIIDGPADGDVYTLGFAQPLHSPAKLHERIAALRANPGVLFAEPVQDGVR